MPRGVYDRTKAGARKPKEPQAWDLQTTVSSEGVDYLILHAERDELAEVICHLLDAQTKANAVAEILQRRVDRLLKAPSDIAAIGEQLRSFGPPQPSTEDPNHAQTGTDPA